MCVDLEGLNECEWLLKMASESDGKIKYFVHAKEVVVGGKKIDVQNENERSRWLENIRVLEADEHIELTDERLGSLTYMLL